MRIRRLLAAYIDFMVCLILSTAITAVVTCGKLDTTSLSIAEYFISFTIFEAFKDFVFKGSSVGKRVFKLRVVKIDETHLTFVDTIKRAAPLILFPIEIILVIINDRRIGDVWAKTLVKGRL